MLPIDTLPKDTQELISNLTERRTHSDTMRFTKEDAEQLQAWEDYLTEIYLARK